MDVAKQVIHPLGVVVNVVPSAPATINEEIHIIQYCHPRGKRGERIVPEVDVAFVVPRIELGCRLGKAVSCTRILLPWIRFLVVNQVNTLVFFKNAEVLHVTPVIGHRCKCLVCTPIGYKSLRQVHLEIRCKRVPIR